jgi:hypothetical protein
MLNFKIVAFMTYDHRMIRVITVRRRREWRKPAWGSKFETPSQCMGSVEILEVCMVLLSHSERWGPGRRRAAFHAESRRIIRVGESSLSEPISGSLSPAIDRSSSDTTSRRSDRARRSHGFLSPVRVFSLTHTLSPAIDRSSRLAGAGMCEGSPHDAGCGLGRRGRCPARRGDRRHDSLAQRVPP